MTRFLCTKYIAFVQSDYICLSYENFDDLPYDEITKIWKRHAEMRTELHAAEEAGRILDLAK